MYGAKLAPSFSAPLVLTLMLRTNIIAPPELSLSNTQKAGGTRNHVTSFRARNKNIYVSKRPHTEPRLRTERKSDQSDTRQF